MNANELMIGDWVKLKDAKLGNINFVGPTVQIKSITGRHVLVPNAKGLLEDVTEEYLLPIELTPEILEKNGFERNPLWHHCDKDLDDYSISVQLGYANRIEYIKIAEKGKDNVIPSERTKLYLTHIKYVHELQHALRLCGINKVIVL